MLHPRPMSLYAGSKSEIKMMVTSPTPTLVHILQPRKKAPDIEPAPLAHTPQRRDVEIFCCPPLNLHRGEEWLVLRFEMGASLMPAGWASRNRTAP